jgi:hypothetical protein
MQKVRNSRFWFIDLIKRDMETFSSSIIIEIAAGVICFFGYINRILQDIF